LLLHGGAGPQSVGGFGELLAATHDARAINPVHPGFGGTPRPENLVTIGGLAAMYVALLDQLDLSNVTIVGNSIGGWIAAEMALLESPRVSGVVLIDAVGIEVPGHPVADFFSLSMDQVFSLSFHNPEPFRIDPTTLPPAAQAIAAGNRAALAVYAGTSMSDATLAERLRPSRCPHWCSGVTATRSPTPTTDAPMRRPSLWPGSSCSPTPAICPSSRPPTRRSKRSGNFADTDCSEVAR
jgi:pimeloyl-ACP methyl ester carboxylesterase